MTIEEARQARDAARVTLVRYYVAGAPNLSDFEAAVVEYGGAIRALTLAERPSPSVAPVSVDEPAKVLRDGYAVYGTSWDRLATAAIARCGQEADRLRRLYDGEKKTSSRMRRDWEKACAETVAVETERDVQAAEIARLKAELGVVKTHAGTTAGLRDHWRTNHEVACATLGVVQGRLEAFAAHVLAHPSDLRACLEGCKCSACVWFDRLFALVETKTRQPAPEGMLGSLLAADDQRARFLAGDESAGAPRISDEGKSWRRVAQPQAQEGKEKDGNS